MAFIHLTEIDGAFFVRFDGDRAWRRFTELKFSAMVALRKVLASELGAGAELRHDFDDATLDRARKTVEAAIGDREAALDRIFAEAETEEAEAAALSKASGEAFTVEELPRPSASQ